MTTRAKNWILRPYLDSAHWIEKESTILVTDTFCVLTSVISLSGWLFKKKSIMMHGNMNVKAINPVYILTWSREDSWRFTMVTELFMTQLHFMLFSMVSFFLWRDLLRSTRHNFCEFWSFPFRTFSYIRRLWAFGWCIWRDIFLWSPAELQCWSSLHGCIVL